MSYTPLVRRYGKFNKETNEGVVIIIYSKNDKADLDNAAERAAHLNSLQC